MNFPFILLVICGILEAAFGIVLFLLRTFQKKSKALADAIISFSICGFILGIGYTGYMLYQIKKSQFTPIFSINRLFVIHGIIAFLLAAFTISFSYLKNKAIPEKLKNALSKYSQKDMAFYTSLEKAFCFIKVITYATMAIVLATLLFLLCTKHPGWFLFYIPNTIAVLLPAAFTQILYY